MFRLKKTYYIDRTTGKRCKEEVYGELGLAVVYPNHFLFRLITLPLRIVIQRWTAFSKWYGALQRRSKSRKKIKPFIEKFGIDPSEFEKPVEAFTSFDDFFSRKIKRRSIAETDAIIPADGRYRFFPNVAHADGFYVKGKKFTLEGLLQDGALAQKYEQGAMAIARLCPTDYHRYHFPCSGIPDQSIAIDGHLGSVNPAHLRQNINVFAHNKRMLTVLNSDHFGEVLLIEVGATCVGTIHQTYQPHQHVEKGDEKGYFSFGGSAMVILFEPGSMVFAEDLLHHDEEVRCLLGQSLTSKLTAFRTRH